MKTSYTTTTTASRVVSPQSSPHILSHKKEMPDCFFIHGMWGDSSQWRDWCEYLGQVPSSSFNLREETYPTGEISLSDYVHKVVTVLVRNLRHKDGGPSYLIGHSMGGLIAQLVARVQPGLVKGVVLIASSPPRWRRFPIHQLPYRSWFTKYLWRVLTCKPFTLSPRDKQRLCGDVQVGLSWESGRAARDVLFGAYKLSELKCPSLVLAASNDVVLPVDLERTMAWRLGSEFIIRDGGHMCHCDPKSQLPFMNVAREWIRRQERS